MSIPWGGAVHDALGYHDQNNRGLPYGFVFTELSKKFNEEWTVTLSHEALELVGDANANTLVMGPHPKEDRVVFHWYEMCDAVQSDSYKVDGVGVSNFLLPLYFTEGEQRGGRNDFLGRHPLRSFGINPGGYIGFFDPKTGKHATVTADAKAADRHAKKAALRSSLKDAAGRLGRSGDTLVSRAYQRQSFGFAAAEASD